MNEFNVLWDNLDFTTQAYIYVLFSMVIIGTMIILHWIVSFITLPSKVKEIDRKMDILIEKITEDDLDNE